MAISFPSSELFGRPNRIRRSSSDIATLPGAAASIRPRECLRRSSGATRAYHPPPWAVPCCSPSRRFRFQPLRGCGSSPSAAVTFAAAFFHGAEPGPLPISPLYGALRRRINPASGREKKTARRDSIEQIYQPPPHQRSMYSIKRGHPERHPNTFLSKTQPIYQKLTDFHL